MTATNDDDDPSEKGKKGKGDKPTLRQRLHEAAGDRDAEAKALLDRSSGELDERDATIAVQRAHDEAGVDAPPPPDDLARPTDAEEVHDELSS